MRRLHAHLLIAMLPLLFAEGAEAAERYRPTLIYNGPTLDQGAHSHPHLPDVSAASGGERRAAAAFLERVERLADRRFANVRTLAALGYRRGGGMRFIGQDKAEHRVRTPFVHFKNAGHVHDSRVLDPTRPEALIYWKRPRGRPVLVGFMFRAPSLERPPDRGLGPFMIWHAHAICDDGRERGNPLQFRTARCGSGLAHHGATQMTHVWLTKRLRFAYALEAPARQLGVFIEHVPALYSGGGSPPGGHAHGQARAHGHGVDLTASELVVGNAWAVGALTPLFAGATLLTRRRRRSRGVRLRLIGIACLGGIAVTHAADLGAHIDDATYLAALFCALIVGVAGLSVMLAIAREPAEPWLVAALLSLAAAAGYVMSRTIGLPGLGHHVGDWGEPAALLALGFEALVVLLAVPLALGRLRSPTRRTADPARTRSAYS